MTFPYRVSCGLGNRERVRCLIALIVSYLVQWLRCLLCLRNGVYRCPCSILIKGKLFAVILFTSATKIWLPILVPYLRTTRRVTSSCEIFKLSSASAEFTANKFPVRGVAVTLAGSGSFLEQNVLQGSGDLENGGKLGYRFIRFYNGPEEGRYPSDSH